jgi:phosphoglycolate phosphatase-like HAD superfamily hydrolase
MKSGAVILDVDGTLVDSNDAHARAWVEALAERGITVPFEEMRRAIGMGGDKLLPRVVGIADDSKDGQAVARRRGEIFKENYLPRIRPFPCTRKLLERFIGDSLELAVATSAKEDELGALLQIAGVPDLISARTSSDDAENSKPDPDIVVAAIKRVRVERNRIIMLGDTPYDVQAATGAGIRIVALECGGWTAGELRGAIAVYESPEDLLRHYAESPFPELTSLTSTSRTS